MGPYIQARGVLIVELSPQPGDPENMDRDDAQHVSGPGYVLVVQRRDDARHGDLQSDIEALGWRARAAGAGLPQ